MNMTDFSAALHFSASFFEYRTRLNDNGLLINQGYSIVLRKGSVTNVKIFRGPVTHIKSCKCDMSWIFLTKNLIREFTTIILYIHIQNPVNGNRY